MAPVGLGADGIEIHEPRLEECPRHRLQCLIHPAVQLDLVVQRAEDLGDGALFGERRDTELEVRDIRASKTIEDRAYVDEFADLVPPVPAPHEPP